MQKKELKKMKKFRFELLSTWLAEHTSPCRVADIGGGKGLLTFLLEQAGFSATVVDPHPQALPLKYTDLHRKLIRIPPGTAVPHQGEVFSKTIAKDFDLLLGLHAHGSNMKIIEAAKEHGKAFLIFPCCVIDEPIEVRANVNWFDSLVEYAKSLGHKVEIVELNFRGQNRGIYSSGVFPFK